MRTRLLRLVALILCMTVWGGYIAGQSLRIACIGNSITEGMGIADKAKDSYPAQLGQMLGEGYDVRNFGVSGRTMLRKGDYPYWNEQAYADCKQFCPDVVILKLGTNDSKGYNWIYKKEFQKDMQDMIDELSALPSHPVIYLGYPAKAFQNPFGISDAVITGEIIPIIGVVAEANNLPVIDFHSAFEDKPYLMQGDSIHPNEKGATMMAALVRTVLTNAGIVNAGFETGEISGEPSGLLPQGWDSTGDAEKMEFVLSENEPAEGSKCLEIKNNGAMMSGICQEIPQLAEGEYILKADVWTVTTGESRIFVNGKNGKLISQETGQAGQWVTLTVKFQVRSGDGPLTIGLETGNGQYKVDHFRIDCPLQKLQDIYRNVMEEKRKQLMSYQNKLNAPLNMLAQKAIEATADVENNEEKLVKAINKLSYACNVLSEIGPVWETAKGNLVLHQNVLENSECTNDTLASLYEKAIKEHAALLDTVMTVESIGVSSDHLTAVSREYVYWASPQKGKTMDVTFLMNNPQVLSADGWINGSIAFGYEYDGAPDSLYLDKWNALLVTYQGVELPKGIYRLTAATRASEYIAEHFIYMSVGARQYRTDGHKVGSIGNELGNGWGWTVVDSVTVPVDAGAVKIGFYANAVNLQWASADDFRLEKIGVLSSEEDLDIMKQKLSDTMEKAGMIDIKANVGVESLQRPLDLAENLTDRIAMAERVMGKKSTLNEVKRSLMNLEEAIQEFEQAELNRPAEGERFCLVASHEAYTDCTLTRVDKNTDRLQFMQGPDPDMSQSLELVKMEEGNRYMAVMTDDDGGLNYLCEGADGLVSLTAEQSEALLLVVEATGTDGVYRMQSVHTGYFLGIGKDQALLTADMENKDVCVDWLLPQALKAKVDLEIGEAGIGTLILPFSATCPENLEVYDCVGIDQEGFLMLDKAERINACTPYLVVAETGLYHFEGWGVASRTEYSKGMLSGVLKQTETDGINDYVQSVSDKYGVVFCRPETETVISAYSAYVNVDGSAGDQANILRLPSQITAIDCVQADDNRLVDVYTLSGLLLRRGVEMRKATESLEKGVYVINNQKVYVK